MARNRCEPFGWIWLLSRIYADVPFFRFQGHTLKDAAHVNQRQSLVLRSREARPETGRLDFYCSHAKGGRSLLTGH